MSHNINYSIYSISVKEKTINEEINEYVKKATWEEGGHGLLNPIRFIHQVLPDYESAKEFIEKQDKGWYDNLAVMFKQLPKNKTSKKLDTLKEKLNETVKTHNELDKMVIVSTFKAEYIGCKHCGSKLNKNYLKTNYCPLCHNDMRSETVLKKINILKEKITNIRKEIKLEEQKLNEKYGECKWLVKFEYHT